MENLFTSPPRLPLVAPSILSADFAKLAADCAHVLTDGGADLLHIDVMDGHFVPNLTMGPALVRSLRASLPEAFLDVHVMVTDPAQYIEPFAEAGANHMTFHIEPAQDVRAGAGMAPLSEGYDPREVAGKVRAAGMTAGIAINPPTPAASIEHCLEAFDLVLVMSVNPGFSGQAFIPDVLDKVEAIAPRLSGAQRLQMDGGVSAENAARCRSAGCDVLVAASAIFGVPHAQRRQAVESIRS